MGRDCLIDNLCEYSSRCELYKECVDRINRKDAREEDYIQIVEICRTEHRFYETCYKNFSIVDLASSGKRPN